MATNIVVPELGESVVEATVGPWLKTVGDSVQAGETLVELETDKVNLEVSAAQTGVLTTILFEEGADVQIGDVLGTLEEGSIAIAAEDASADPAVPSNEPPDADDGNGDSEPVEERITPVARRIAEKEGVDLSSVHGSGSAGRVTRHDVEEAIDTQSTETGAAPSIDPARESLPPAETFPPGEREEVVRMSRRRRTIAQRLVEAQHTAAMLTTFNEIDMGAVIDIRKQHRDSFEKRHEIKLGFMSFFVKAAVGALQDFPSVNAEIRGDDIVLKHYYDIGIAIGAPEGLVVPVLRGADSMTFAGIERGIKDFVDKAGSGALSMEDLRGGTFTITNGGIFGSMLSTPILNPPQVGILGLHKIEERPIAVNGDVVIRPMMYVALSYDHRIIDGREAVQFLVRLKELIEDPSNLLLNG